MDKIVFYIAMEVFVILAIYWSLYNETVIVT